jgi:hypothetical protein
MNLNEYYCDLIDADNGYDNQLLADRCEKIADKFAIGFAEWIYSCPYPTVDNTTEELLKIYKKL